ncbi:hypothetical protein [Streptomonospora wellingtoniae]|uniref:PEP-CTERM sorting domain-containing protein n=1 Tax=Streptomonospora wellingtoniae TaxID=3075544 RepID=A0ABU2KV96_9ACTN|nr:hypothetical protein [Streptomonospora sp. DSM 45055]MDT0303177.1 hypothetical protein [Streptomonospora sp. DSM 45055]
MGAPLFESAESGGTDGFEPMHIMVFAVLIAVTGAVGSSARR